MQQEQLQPQPRDVGAAALLGLRLLQRLLPLPPCGTSLQAAVGSPAGHTPAQGIGDRFCFSTGFAKSACCRSAARLHGEDLGSGFVKAAAWLVQYRAGQG